LAQAIAGARDRIPARWARRLRMAGVAVLVLVVGLPFLVVLTYRFAPIPATPLMAIRLIEGHGWAHRSADLDEISPHLVRAVVAAEDGRFCAHSGFDWSAIKAAWADYRDGDSLRGASTISMQTAKNVFLWPDRTWTRKALEAYLTLYVEALWPKRRIIEAYLNVEEFGPGIFGAEAASWRVVRKLAADVT